MAFRDFPGPEPGVELLQRSLERRRLAHGYLFSGEEITHLEALAQSLAKTLNCHHPIRSASGVAIDCCDACVSCRKIEHLNHADVYWVRPESKSRVIIIDQIRDLMQAMNLKPTEADYKVGVIVGADRLNVQAANAFLKTLEEPPAKSILVLLTTDAQRILETILSRCLRLSFGGTGLRPLAPAQRDWLGAFAAAAAPEHRSLLSRYLLMDILLQKLAVMKEAIEETLSGRSPLRQNEEAEKELREKWEDELAAAVESEYRRQRSELLSIVQWWLRDVWLHTVTKGGPAETRTRSPANNLLSFPEIPGSQKIAHRISVKAALENLQTMESLQRLLNTNVQEALALEVGLLKLHL